MRFAEKEGVIDAFKWTGEPGQTEDPEWICKAISDGIVYFIDDKVRGTKMAICSPDGTKLASPGDWIVRYKNGIIDSFLSCTFEALYEPIYYPPASCCS